MRFHRQQLRRWSALVLLMWMFGIVMSVVNACAFQPPADAKPAARVHVALSPHHHDDDHSGEAAKANCLDFCEESSLAAPA